MVRRQKEAPQNERTKDLNLDELAKCPNVPLHLIPAKPVPAGFKLGAGIRVFLSRLRRDGPQRLSRTRTGVRRGDDPRDVLRGHHSWTAGGSDLPPDGLQPTPPVSFIPCPTPLTRYFSGLFHHSSPLGFVPTMGKAPKDAGRNIFTPRERHWRD